MVVIKKYEQEHYFTLFEEKTGMFIRLEEKGFPEPKWSNHGPELLDISITNWCEKSCEICYRSSNMQGKHMKLNDYEDILIQARDMGVAQIALGGGNPNQHPDFCSFLKLTRNYGIVPNYTTNGRGLSKDILRASKKNCGAVAISYHEPINEFINGLRLLVSNDIKTNVHFVLTNDSITKAIKWINEIPDFLKGINAVIFLNYKPIGREKNENLMLNQSKIVEEFCEVISQKELPFKIGFDSCSISFISKYLKVNSRYIESCEAGRFSAFISEGLKFYPCSFMMGMIEGVDIRNIKMIEAWKSDIIFTEMRNRILENKCAMCEYLTICNGGCSVFKEINVCPSENA